MRKSIFLTALFIIGINLAHLPAANALIDRTLRISGPINDGICLHLNVTTKSVDSQDTYTVRLEFLNVTDQPITLQADWPYEHEYKKFEDYVIAAVSFVTYPEINLWGCQTAEQPRTSVQPEYTLNPKDSLIITWISGGRRLKYILNMIDPNNIHNSYFPSDGLYSVHAEIKLWSSRSKQSIFLRSNEQLVPVGGSVQTPKFPLAKVLAIKADEINKSARINVGTLHKIENGDKFLIRTGMMDFWELAITDVYSNYSEGTLTQHQAMENSSMGRKFRLPEPGSKAGLIPQGKSDDSWLFP